MSKSTQTIILIDSLIIEMRQNDHNKTKLNRFFYDLIHCVSRCFNKQTYHLNEFHIPNQIRPYRMTGDLLMFKTLYFTRLDFHHHQK